MKKLLLLLTSVFFVASGYSQSDKFWTPHNGTSERIITAKGVARASFPKDFDLYNLNIAPLRQILFSDEALISKSGVVITLPNTKGALEQFEMFEASNFEADLQVQFPEIRAYSGKGITDKYATIKLSISPQGVHTMIFRTDKENEFMEPYSQDGKIYAVFNSSRNKGNLAWSCSSHDADLVNSITNKVTNSNLANNGVLKTMRLAQSCTAEYSNYFGATSSAQVSLVLAAFNTTLTRANGVYEKDLGLHLNLVASSTNVIFYNAATDPYSDGATGAAGPWNTELQNTLSTTLTGPATSLVANNAAYDIGHLFGASGGGGNAGCIGCVCTNDTVSTTDKNKGSGFTSPGDAIPEGDNFDIDYVVHEVGHQLGGTHTFSMGNEGSGTNIEVGSGITIMGYAGITGQDAAPHSIDTYHAVTISQIQSNLATKTCPITTSLTGVNAAPVVNAGVDVTIPKSTPFLLTGSATDANAGDALTYSWEQYDDDTAAQTGAASGASATKTSGPNWISYSPTASPSRYMPKLSTILSNSLTTAGAEINVEALSSVARTLTFRLTVRDNAPYIALNKVAQTGFDDRIITIDATRGPLNVTSQNTAGISWIQGSTQTITWSVNNTNTSTGGANVDILLSTDGGLTFPTTLVAATPNDGTQTITVPNIAAVNCRIMVKASAGIFFNVNTQPIAIGYTVTNTCTTYSNNTALPVPDGVGANTPGPIVNKTIVVPGPSAAISDVNVTLGFTHTYIEDLVIAMNHPDGTQVGLWNRNCDNAPGTLQYVFDDAAAATVPTTGCTATSGTWKPASSLGTLNGKNNNGTWTLLAVDYYNGDVGTIQNWSIEVCSQTATLTTENFGLENFSLYPNPNNGNFNIKFNSSSSNEIKIGVHDMRGRQIFNKSYSNTGLIDQNLQLDNVQAGVYLVTVQDGNRKEVKKIVVE
jgi:subtilisin-like proprotein convertase family protein